ncbi:MAG: hypothetical protein ACUVTW_05760 [Thermogutta sp.]
MPGNMLPGRAVKSPVGNRRKSSADAGHPRQPPEIFGNFSASSVNGSVTAGERPLSPSSAGATTKPRRSIRRDGQTEYLLQMAISGNANNLISLGQLGQTEKDRAGLHAGPWASCCFLLVGQAGSEVNGV